MLNQYYKFLAQQVQIHNYLYFYLCTKSEYFCRVCASVANVAGISRLSSGHSWVRANLHQTNCQLVWISPIRVGVDGDEAAARLSVNTNEADEGRWKTTNPGAGTRSSVFPQITATLRRVGETSGGGRGRGWRALPRRCSATTNTPPWTGSDEWDSWAMRSSIEHAGKRAKDWENGSRQSGD